MPTINATTTRSALPQADVSRCRLIQEFVAKVKERALGLELLEP